MTSKARSCKLDCGYPAAPRRQFCIWHALMRMSSYDQGRAAADRLELSVGKKAISRVPRSAWPPGERWCAGCQSFVPLFYCSGSRCRACNSAAAHARRLVDAYGIDAGTYDDILVRQGGRCAICRNKPRTIRFAVDHDHKTGAVRGVLCARCNHDLLGGGHDDLRIIWRAVEYLLFPPAQHEGRPSREQVLAALEQGLAEPRSRIPEPKECPF